MGRSYRVFRVVCTEVYQSMPTNGVTDFELPYQPNQEANFINWQRVWDVTPRPTWEETSSKGVAIGSGSNNFNHQRKGRWSLGVRLELQSFLRAPILPLLLEQLPWVTITLACEAHTHWTLPQ